MSYKYQIKIGGRTITSNSPFSVTINRQFTYSNGKKEAIQETKEAYCRTMYDDDKPTRQKLAAYKYDDEEQTNYKQYILPKQIATRNNKNQFLLNYYDLRGNNGTINFGS